MLIRKEQDFFSQVLRDMIKNPLCCYNFSLQGWRYTDSNILINILTFN